MIEKKTSRSIKTLRTDNCLEFVDNKVLHYCSRDVVFDENSMLVYSVEKPIDNVISIPIDA